MKSVFGKPALAGLMVVASWATACGDAAELPEEELAADGDDESDDGKFDVLRPVGEEMMGHLRALLPETTLAVPEIVGYWEGHPVREGTTRVPVAAGCLDVMPDMSTTLDPDVDGIAPSIRSRLCDLEVRPAETTDGHLGGLRLIAVPEWTTDVLDPTGSALPRIVTTSAALDLWVQRDGSYDALAGVLLPVAPGRYMLTTRSPTHAPMGGFEAAVEPGEVVEVPIPSADLRTWLRIVPPERVFPDVDESACGRLTMVLKRGVIPRPQPADREGVLYFPPADMLTGSRLHWIEASDAPVELSYVPLEERRGESHLLLVNSLVLPLEQRFGEELEVRLARIDVDDVLVEREDGTSYRVAGRWQVFRPVGSHLEPVGRWRFRQSFSSCRVSGFVTSFPTGTGLDVLPGDYQVVVHYETAVGPQRDVYEMRLE
jgi:hypothetical protein